MKRRIHIAKLQIRLPRTLGGDARRVASDVGREVLTQLAERFDRQTGQHRVDTVTARISRTRFETLGTNAIAANVVADIAKRSDGSNNR